MQNNAHLPSSKIANLRIEDFSVLQTRYQALSLARRAEAVLGDASPALKTAEEILNKLLANKNTGQAIVNIRKNSALIGKMRPSEARNTLLDSSNDFIDVTKHKLAAWSKTMQRLSAGEGITTENGREFIPESEPLASAIVGNACISNYLSMVQLILSELTKIDQKNASDYSNITAETRRCATVLSDYENASDISTNIH